MAERKRAVTRADVARLSGVSTAVVSYVLNDGPRRVAPHTREKVLEAVRALNYRPNVAARALSKGSADIVGMLVADATNPYFAGLIRAIDEQVTARGLSLSTVSTDNSAGPLMSHFEGFAAQRVQGVVSVHSMGQEALSHVRNLGLRTVLVNQDEPQPGVLSVRVNYREGARGAVEHLIGHGYETIAFIGADERARLREHGWAEAITAAGLAHLPPVLTSFSLEGGFAGGEEIASWPEIPRAVFVASDQMAMGVLAALHRKGLRVPEDVAVIGFDGVAESEYMWPPLTTVRQPVERIAEMAIGLLLESLPESSYGVDTELLVRRTCGCPAE